MHFSAQSLKRSFFESVFYFTDFISVLFVSLYQPKIVNTRNGAFLSSKAAAVATWNYTNDVTGGPSL